MTNIEEKKSFEEWDKELGGMTKDEYLKEKKRRQLAETSISALGKVDSLLKTLGDRMYPKEEEPEKKAKTKKDEGGDNSIMGILSGSKEA